MSMTQRERGERLLEFVIDEVHQRLNPNGDECSFCGGEGFTYDCIDGCCVDAESGCEQCAQRCVECRIFSGTIAKAIRVEVLKMVDIDVAIAWAKQQGRWQEELPPAEVLANLHAARTACDAFTIEERADSACWVEALA